MDLECRGSSRRRLRQALFLCVLLPTIAPGCTHIKTARIEGVIRDQQTKAPIPNALVRAGWTGWVSMFPEAQTAGFHGETVISDAQGRYSIPSTSFWISFISSMSDIAFSVTHPLYLQGRWIWGWSKNVDNNESYQWHFREYGKQGVLVWDVDLISIEDHFSKETDLFEYSGHLSAARPRWWLALKADYGLRYDLDEVLATHRRIAERVGILRQPEWFHKRRYIEFTDGVGQVKKEGY